jgi:hypothetical protein
MSVTICEEERALLDEESRPDSLFESPLETVHEPASKSLGALSPHVIVFGAVLLSLGMSMWQVTQSKYVGFYDAGVYLAASIHFVSGAMPYRDFAFVQPPGILILMSPAALVSRLFGSYDGFVVARVITGLVSAANVGMLTCLVRRRGRLAMLIAGVGLALLPLASQVSTALLLEQYLVFFVLLGSLVIFSKERSGNPPSTRALVFGGALFGFAALVKIWAIFPFVALVITLALLHRKKVWALVLGAGGSFLAFALPFFLAAPSNFIRQIFVEQLTRKSFSADDVSTLGRLTAMTGLSLTRFPPTAKEVLSCFVVLLCMVAVAYTRRGTTESLDRYLLLATSLSVLGLLASPVFYPHYAYFALPFLLGLLAVSVGRIRQSLPTLIRTYRFPPSYRRCAIGVSAFIGLLVIFGSILWDTNFYSLVSAGESANYANLAAIPRYIPAGSCVVYDVVGYGVLENRLLSTDPKCPDVVDPVGMRLARGSETAPAGPALVAQWKSYFEAAQYVVRDAPVFSTIPANETLDAWFTNNYHMIYSGAYVQIYQHDNRA